jgi:hypothetical protein
MSFRSGWESPEGKTVVFWRFDGWAAVWGWSKGAQIGKIHFLENATWI